jgi:hypothetical protein
MDYEIPLPQGRGTILRKTYSIRIVDPIVDKKLLFIIYLYYSLLGKGHYLEPSPRTGLVNGVKHGREI